MAGTVGIRKDDEERSHRGVRDGHSSGPGGKTRSGRASTSRGHSAAALSVRPGERPWSDAELAEVRARLETEVAELRSEISQAESEIAARLTDSVGDAGDDSADAGAKSYQRERDLALTNNARQLLAQDERALARMADGTYGTCESCGNPIGKARLLAFPRANLCVQCKQREERR
jgi:RNA polymerase-binding transcription factor